MALKFKCQNCGKDVIVTGESAKCRYCGVENTIPENSIETDEEYPITEFPKSEESQIPEETKIPINIDLQRNIRSFGKVFGLSIITIGIYYFVYLFRTLREIESAFVFNPQEANPKQARKALKLYIFVTVITAIASGYIGFLTEFSPDAPSIKIWQVITTVINIPFSLYFWSSFTSLLRVCQSKKGIIPLGQTIIMLVWIEIVLSFVVLKFEFFSLVSAAIGISIFYLTVKEVNRIWRQG